MQIAKKGISTNLATHSGLAAEQGAENYSVFRHSSAEDLSARMVYVRSMGIPVFDLLGSDFETRVAEGMSRVTRGMLMPHIPSPSLDIDEDWKEVGRDIQWAMNEYEHEQRERNPILTYSH